MVTSSRRTLTSKSVRSVRVLSIRFAKPGSAVAVYARVLSTTRPDKLVHNVTRVRGERQFRCTCEAGALGGHSNCKHIRKVRVKIAARRAA